MRRSRNNRGRSNQEVHKVVTVPTLLRPTFSVPVQFQVTASGNITLPTGLNGHPIRVTSMRATAVAANNATSGTFTIELGSGVSGGAGVRTRNVCVSSSPIEIQLRNNKYVQPVNGVAGGSGTVLAAIAMSNCVIVGVIMVTVMSSF